jgi:hypothetical protein
VDFAEVRRQIADRVRNARTEEGRAVVVRCHPKAPFQAWMDVYDLVESVGGFVVEAREEEQENRAAAGGAT